MEQAKPGKKSNVRLWGWLLLAAALVMFAVGGYPLVKQAALDTIGVETTGTVIDLYGADRIKTPIVQFTAEDGSQYTFKSYYGNRNIRFVAGEEVQMSYLAFNPQIAEVNLLGRINYPSNLGTTCIGTFLLMGGLVAFQNKPLVLDFSRKK